MYPTNQQIHNAVASITGSLRYLRGEFQRGFGMSLSTEEKLWRIEAANRALDDLKTLEAALRSAPATAPADLMPTPLSVLAASLPPLAGGAPCYEPTVADLDEYERWLDSLPADRRVFHERVRDINEGFAFG